MNETRGSQGIFSFSLVRSGLLHRRRYVQKIFDPALVLDLALLLFTFFLVSGQYVVRQPGVRIHLPESSQADAVPFTSMVVTIASEGLVFFNDERTTMEGLRDSLQRMAFEHPDHTLLIEADELLANSVLIRLYTQAREAGIRDIAVATRLRRPEIPAEEEVLK